MRRTLFCFYLFAVSAVVLVGWFWFRELFSLVPEPPVSGSSLAMLRHTRYRGFFEGASLVLGLFLGSATGYTGHEKQGVLERAGLLAAGWVLTAVVFALLPRCYFHGYDFAAWLMWLAGSFYPAVGSWLATVLYCAVVKDKSMAG